MTNDSKGLRPRYYDICISIQRILIYFHELTDDKLKWVNGYIYFPQTNITNTIKLPSRCCQAKVQIKIIEIGEGHQFCAIL